jgi:nickel-dependent lactate racemase
MNTQTRPVIPYGNNGLRLPVAAGALPLLTATGLAPARDPVMLMRRAAERAADAVTPLVSAHGRLALIVPDRTRPLPLPELLGLLLDALARRGLPAQRVSVLPASGIHRPMTRNELIAWVGRAVPERGAALLPHDAGAPGVLLGHGPTGLPMAVHPALAGADAALLLGRIVFHYIAGFGGGRKLLAPGVATRRTVLAVHRRCLDPDPRQGRHPQARAGVLEGNPMNSAVREVAGLAPPTVALHVLHAADGAIADIEVSDALDGHATAARRYARANTVNVESPLDAVIVGAGGAPTDRDLVQAHKGLDAIAPIVRDGGLVVLVAACSDGVGNREVLDALALGSVRAISQRLRRGFLVGAHTALALAEKTERLDVRMVSELPDAAVRAAGMRRLSGADEAWSLVDAIRAAGGRCALAPAGGALLYRVASSP